MKTVTFLLAGLAIASLANAQKVNDAIVPAQVKAAFAKQFTEAKAVKWEKEKGNFEAGFTVNGVKHSAIIAKDGGVLETEVTCTLADLPAAAKMYLSKNFAGKKIKEVATITNAKGVTTFEAEVNGKDLIFDKAGKFLRTVKD